MASVRFADMQSHPGSCPCSLRLIQQPDKPGKMSSFQHVCEEVLPWFPIFFCTSWCW